MTNQLDEAFDSEVPHTVVKDTRDEFVATATVGGREIVFSATLSWGTTWHVQFHEVTAKGKITFQATGSGNEFGVFAFVVQMIRDLVRKRQPKELIFDAYKSPDGKNSRSKLYHRMASKLNLPGYSMDVLEYPAGDKFIFQRMTGVREGLLPTALAHLTNAPILLETTEEDRAIISLSETIWKYIQRYGQLSDEIRIGKIGDLFTTPLAALQNTSLVLSTNDTLADMLEVDDVVNGTWDPTTNTIHLNVDRILLPVMRRTITHELRHALDNVKSRGKSDTSTRYNAPKTDDPHRSTLSELNARFVEVLHGIKVYVAHARKNNVPNPRQYALQGMYKLLDDKRITQFYPERTKSKEYQRFIKRAVDMVDKELKYTEK